MLSDVNDTAYRHHRHPYYRGFIRSLNKMARDSLPSLVLPGSSLPPHACDLYPTADRGCSLGKGNSC